MNSSDFRGVIIGDLAKERYSLFDLLPPGSPVEKLVSLALSGIPPGIPVKAVTELSQSLKLLHTDTSDLHVVVFGGGTGLSNIVGGDSRQLDWPSHPSRGLKQLFSRLHSIVCITDDGGSTGELQKDLPLIALGDLRHVLLSSIRPSLLKNKYFLDDSSVDNLITTLHSIFNYRFISRPQSAEILLQETGAELDHIPSLLHDFLLKLLQLLFAHDHLQPTLERPQCLGNLLLAASIYQDIDSSRDPQVLAAEHEYLRTATMRGLASLSRKIGAQAKAVLPCTTTPAQLQVLYENGVLVSGESKSDQANRGYPVNRVFVQYHQEPFLPPEVVEVVRQADIIVFAPGSLYSSIIPIFQDPVLVGEVRRSKALKLLISNIWVQKGETDVAMDDPRRKYHASDMIKAYERNIPGGIQGLFSLVLGLDLADIPGSVLQNYALENKEPIYFDRHAVRKLGFEALALPIFSSEKLQRRGVIQHDPSAVANAVKTLWALHEQGALLSSPDRDKKESSSAKKPKFAGHPVLSGSMLPCKRFQTIVEQLQYISVDAITDIPGQDGLLPQEDRDLTLARMAEMLWLHPDIVPKHLRNIRGVTLIDPQQWQRCQEWDNVFSFYDPDDKFVKIRSDQIFPHSRFEMVFLVALGQSLLGNYAQSKCIEPVKQNGEQIGRIYTLTMRPPDELLSYFTSDELDQYLCLAKMCPSEKEKRMYTRLISGDAGFTPPGLLFGLFFAWYLDNSFAANVEYKMSIMRSEISDLIPEQIKLVEHRRKLISFFRETVFGHKDTVTR